MLTTSLRLSTSVFRAGTRCFPILFPLLLLSSTALAQQDAEPVAAASQRSSFVTDTAVVAPGTVELDFGAASTGGFLGMPAAILFTPDVESGILQNTEFSIGFDALASSTTRDDRITQFGDRVGLAVRRMILRKGNFSLAVAPQALFFLRTESGARLGGVVAGVYHFGLNAVVGDFVWSTATQPSEAIPRHQHDFVAGFSRTLGNGPFSSRFGVFAEYLHEFPHGQPNLVSLAQGVGFSITPDTTIDFAIQQSGLKSGPVDLQVLGGLAVNLGNWRRLGRR